MATIKEMLTANTADILEATELLKVLGDREGQFVWKQLTAEGGDFVAFVTADDEGSYPNGGMQEGYWYEPVIEGDGTWAEITTATTAGKTIYSAHDNPNAVYGGGYLPQTYHNSLYYNACVGIWGNSMASLTCTTVRSFDDGAPSISTRSITISGNKITIPSIAYGNDPALTLRLTVCHV